MSDWWEKLKKLSEEQERLEKEQGGGLLIPDGVPWDVKRQEMEKGTKSVFWVWTCGKPDTEAAP